MAVAYTKEFLMDAFISRYAHILTKEPNKLAEFTKMCSDFYDKAGRDKFRVYTSLDAAAIRAFKAQKK